MANPVIEVIGESELVIVPEPEIKLQVPTPTVAELAVINVFGLLIHNVWFAPALEMVGASLTIIATVEIEGAHGEFEIVQEKIFVPTASPVIDVVGDNELVITPVPDTNDQVPMPTVAVLAFIVVVGEEIQSV